MSEIEETPEPRKLKPMGTDQVKTIMIDLPKIFKGPVTQKSDGSLIIPYNKGARKGLFSGFLDEVEVNVRLRPDEKYGPLNPILIGMLED